MDSLARAHRSSVALLVVVCLLANAGLASARSFAMADNDDDQLRALAARLDVDDDRGADVLVLARTALIELRRYDASCTENRMMSVRRNGVEGIDRLVLPLDADRVRRARGWVVRADGSVHREDAERRDGTWEIDYPPLVAGDVFGWTSVSATDHGVDHEAVPLLDRWPVLRTRIHVKTEKNLRHVVRAENVGELQVEVADREPAEGQSEWFQIDALELPARSVVEGGDDLPRARPHVRIARHARYYLDLGVWLRSDDWDRWAALEIGPLEDWVDHDDTIRDLAIEQTVRSLDHAERADDLYRWLVENVALRRDPGRASVFEDEASTLDLDVEEIQRRLAYKGREAIRAGQRLPAEWDRHGRVTGTADLGARNRAWSRRDFHEVLEAGEGTAVERTAMLASLFDAVGLKWSLGFTRDSRQGRLESQVTGRWQVTDLVLVVRTGKDGPMRRYCVSRTQLAPDALGPGLQDAAVMLVDPQIGARMEEIWSAAWTEADGRPRRVLELYLDEVGAAELAVEAVPRVTTTTAPD